MAVSSSQPRSSVTATSPQHQQQQHQQFLAIREAIDHHAPMASTPSTPPSPANRSPRGRNDEQRLSIIAEDADAQAQFSRAAKTAPPPAVPPRSTHRPFSRRWRDAPPRASHDGMPPEYTAFEESKRRDPLAELRNRPAVARRGGWKRLLIFIILGLAILAIALGVGLGVGLTRNHNSSNSPSSEGSSSQPSTENQTFPAGQYSITTYLDTVSTACTNISSTFRCYPYSTYSSSPTSSIATFNWIITGSGTSYNVSSADNPFSITFSNQSLTLVDAGTATERYTFSMPMNKLVIPGTPITTDNMQAQCYFNGTLLNASLYTRMNGTNTTNSMPSSSSTTSDGQVAWQPWPFAASINQTISGGDNVPSCFEVANGRVGAPVTNNLGAQPASSQCGCFYRNFDL